MTDYGMPVPLCLVDVYDFSEEKCILYFSTSPDVVDLLTCQITTPKLRNFVKSEQEFKIEYEIDFNVRVNIDEIVDWINIQSPTMNWSLGILYYRQTMMRHRNRNGILIFSFDNSHVASLFKLMYG